MDERIKNALLEALEERGLGFDACVHLYPDRVEIDTLVSRDPRRSSNGGEYHFWLKVCPGESGTLIREVCSCDFWQPSLEPTPIAGAWEDILAHIVFEAGALGIPVVSGA